MVLIGRDEELGKIIDSITYRKSLLITGVNGIGKTSILREVFELQKENSIWLQAPFTPRELLEAIARKLMLSRGGRMGELWRRVMWVLNQREDPLILFLDDFDALSTNARKLLKKMGENVTLIASAERRVTFPFEEELELKPLSRKHSLELVEWKLGDVDDWVKNVIATHSLGIPGKIMELCKRYEIARKFGRKKHEIIELLTRGRPIIWKKVNLLSTSSIISLAYLLLVLKVLLHGASSKGALTVAIFGYATMALARLLRSFKRNENEEG